MQDETAASSRRSDQLAGQIMSPFCPGKTLQSCTSPNAAAWRADIHRWAAEGVSSAEIRQRLEARAGHSLSSVPAEGQAFWMPLVTVLLALLTFGLLAVRMRRRLAPEPQAPVEGEEAATTEAEWDRRLDDELAALE